MIPAVLVTLLAVELVDAIGLVGIVCGSLMGLLGLVGYIARQVRRGVKLLDVVTEDTPRRLDALEQRHVEDRDSHQAAHTEMLSAVSALGAKVDALGAKVDDVAQRQAQDHASLEGLTRPIVGGL